MRSLVTAVAKSRRHSFSKPTTDTIELAVGLGVAGDAHAGKTVKHRSRVAKDPTQPNLRQVHLIHAELLAHLNATGFAVAPGDLGENITTSGIDLLGLPTDTELAIGATAIIRITGLRNPCLQLDRFQAGLTSAVLDRATDGTLIRKAGIMAVVVAAGSIQPGDEIGITLPVGAQLPLQVV